MKYRTIVLVAVLTSLAGPPALASDAASTCAKAGNDDIVHHYTPSMKAAFVRAYKRLFPEGGPPDQAMLAEGSYRCMDGTLVACFVGANLPCAKIVATRTNAGADAFCREPSNRNQDIVPMAATGHDALYDYRCRNGRAIVSGKAWELDARGFAKSIWAPMN